MRFPKVQLSNWEGHFLMLCNSRSHVSLSVSTTFYRRWYWKSKVPTRSQYILFAKEIVVTHKKCLPLYQLPTFVYEIFSGWMVVQDFSHFIMVFAHEWFRLGEIVRTFSLHFLRRVFFVGTLFIFSSTGLAHCYDISPHVGVVLKMFQRFQSKLWRSPWAKQYEIV